MVGEGKAMGIEDLIGDETIVFDSSITSKEGLLKAAAELFAARGDATDAQGLLDDFHKRELEVSTGVEDGFGIPHAKSPRVTTAALAFFHTSLMPDYVGLDDEPIECAFVIVCPENGADVHLEVLSRLARRLCDDEFRAELKAATTREAVIKALAE